VGVSVGTGVGVLVTNCTTANVGAGVGVLVTIGTTRAAGMSVGVGISAGDEAETVLHAAVVTTTINQAINLLTKKALQLLFYHPASGHRKGISHGGSATHRRLAGAARPARRLDLNGSAAPCARYGSGMSNTSPGRIKFGLAMPLKRAMVVHGTPKRKPMR
jgi:hypothetical protein